MNKLEKASLQHAAEWLRYQRTPQAAADRAADKVKRAAADRAAGHSPRCTLTRCADDCGSK